MNSHGKQAGAWEQRLHKIISGGGYLAPELAANFNRLGISIAQGYGMSECSPKISSPDWSRPDKSGICRKDRRPVPGAYRGRRDPGKKSFCYDGILQGAGQDSRGDHRGRLALYR